MTKTVEKKRTSQATGATNAAAGGRFFRFYWWRTPPAVGLVEDCS